VFSEECEQRQGCEDIKMNLDEIRRFSAKPETRQHWLKVQTQSSVRWEVLEGEGLL
jgi:hypothetical protein